MATTIARAPNSVLPKATPIGVKKVSASSINKKEAPQIRPAIENQSNQVFVLFCFTSALCLMLSKLG
jgi:hypothetical protein